ncbi:MAG: choice-of-anchor C family protein [bacterium]
MKTLVLAATVAVLSFLQPATAATIVNGDFEQQTVSGDLQTLGIASTALTGWTVRSGSIDHVGSYWQASHGDQSLDMSGSRAGAISQTVKGLVQGQSYQILFDLSGNPDAGSGSMKRLKVSMNPSKGGTFSYTYVTSGTRDEMNWSEQVFSFVATSKKAVLTFASKTRSAYGPALDNVRFAPADTEHVSAVPLPAGAPLLIGGIAALGALRRRRRAA